MFKEWQKFVREQKKEEMLALIDEERIKLEETRKLINNAFRDGAFKTDETDIDRLMPPVSLYCGGNRDAKK